MRIDRLPHFRAALAITLAALVGACAGSAPGLPSSPPAASGDSPGAQLPRSARPPAGQAAGAPPDAWLAVGVRGEPGVRVIRASTGERSLDLPVGAPRAGWGRIVTATPEGGSTIVADVAVQPGLGGPELRLAGSWSLPTVGADPLPTGVSADGSTIVLVDAGHETEPRASSFAVVQHHLLEAPATAGDAPLRLVGIVELDGAWEYDALSPDGRVLYVVQHLDGEPDGRYQVRAIDLPAGTMRDTVIADKRNLKEAMAGWPITQLRRDDGLVLTLYRGREHPFVHALNTREAWAVCIDLPADGQGDADAALDWGMAAAPDRRSAYAVNATLGLAVEIDLAKLVVRRTAAVGTTGRARPPAIVLAKFGHAPVGPVGRRVVVSPDGATIFAAGRDGVAVIGRDGLALIRRDLRGFVPESIGLSHDGSTLYALLREGGGIVALDTATGRHAGTVPGADYDRLVAVAPS